MKRIVIVFFVLIGAFSQAQVFTHKITAGEDLSSSNALVYALPQVMLRLDVWVEKTDYVKGPYASYASRLLGITDVISADKQSFRMLNVSLSKFYVPDPNQLYYTELGELNGKTENSRFLQMNESGLFMGFSSADAISGNEVEYRTIEITKKGERGFRYYADANLVEKVDTIIRRVDVDTSSIEKVSLKYTKIEKDIAKRAQDAATSYMDIRKNRIDLISGYQEIAYDAGTFSMMNNELKQMEDDYLALFAGKKMLTDEHYVFYYTPSADQPNIIDPIFKFSEDLGLKYLSASGGEKVSIAIKSSGLAEKMMDAETTTKISGVVYRFPETAEVWVKYGMKEYDRQIMTIPQLGKIQTIQMGTNVFELHPSSGGLKVLEIRE